MNIVDANVLLYAVNSSAEHHEESLRWLDAQLNEGSTTGFSWLALLAFVRLSTKTGLFAHLAALAVEHKATVVTYDSDFGRFPGVSWRRPGDAQPRSL